MALDDLQGVIEKLQDMIETHRSYLSGHETRTRQVLIDPLLRELGWDVSDPEAVQLEYRVGQQWADYALMSDGQPVAVIEAKPLGSSLKDREMGQAFGYATLDVINYMIVTDGDKWEMYDVFKKVALAERLLMKLELSQQPAHKNALQALAMWRSNLISEEPVFASLKSTTDQSGSKSDNSPKDSDNWCSFESELYEQGTKPVKLKIGDNPEETVKNWKAAIHKVVAWLADEGKLSVSNSPIGTEKYTFIGREAVNPDGTPFKRPQSLSSDLILQRGYVNTQEQWRKVRQLLDQFGVDKSTIRVSYEPTGQASR